MTCAHPRCWRLLAVMLLGSALVALPAARAALAADGTTPAALEARYGEAARAYHALQQDAHATAAQWRAVAERFRAITADAPTARRGADASYSAALAGRMAWQVSGEWRDLSRAVAQFREFAAGYPQDRLADDALIYLGSLLAQGYTDLPGARDAYRRVLRDYAQGDQVVAAHRQLAAVEAMIAANAERERIRAAEAAAASAPAAPGGPTASLATPDGNAAAGRGGRIKRVQTLSALESTRVILTTDPGVSYTVNRLGADARHPARLYLDLHGQPAEALAGQTAVGDAVLEQIRIGRYDDDTTRVVLDLKELDRFEVKDYRLPSERKIVLDLHPSANALAAARRRARSVAGSSQPVPAANRLLPEPAIKVPAGLRVRSIMIDPGHGGHDPGATAFGLEEKDLALAISKRLRKRLREHHPELRVSLTRDTDVFIPLHERPLIAKRFGADLFVSVHLNANPFHRFHGVETYFLNLTEDPDALQVAARENATSAQRAHDLNDILQDLLRDTTLIESGELAKTVQAALVGTLRGETHTVRDLGVKQAPFLVLMGAEMPSVLVEAGFITNRQENQRLRDPEYLDGIAEGIYDGLRRYIEQQSIISAPPGAEPVALNNRR